MFADLQEAKLRVLWLLLAGRYCDRWELLLRRPSARRNPEFASIPPSFRCYMRNLWPFSHLQIAKTPAWFVLGQVPTLSITEKGLSLTDY
jgi:hypothetical protein